MSYEMGNLNTNASEDITYARIVNIAKTYLSLYRSLILVV